ncbi:MAG: hypothetical protein U0237_00225 [Thermoleophilia bacterium]
MPRRPLVLALMLLAVPAGAAAAPPGATVLVSRPTGSAALSPGIAQSLLGPGRALSTDGRYVVFTSASDGLDPVPVHDALQHCFLRDTVAGSTVLLDRANGVAGDGDCTTPAVSGDGSAVAFTSTAANLVDGDTNGVADVFVWQDGAVTRASVDDAGGQLAEASADPDLTVTGDGDSRAVQVVFGTAAAIDPADGNGLSDVYARVLPATGAASTALMSRATGASGVPTTGGGPSISADGSRIAYVTPRVLGGAAFRGGYLRDLAGDTLTQVTTSTGLVQISRDGRAVAFTSSGYLGFGDPVLDFNPKLNFVRAYLWREGEPLRAVSVADDDPGRLSGGWVTGLSISDDGARVAFRGASGLEPGGFGGGDQVHIRDVPSGRTLVAAGLSSGAIGDPRTGIFASISGDGTAVAFDGPGRGVVSGGASDRRQVYVRRTAGGATVRASLPSGRRLPAAAQRVDDSTLSFPATFAYPRQPGTGMPDQAPVNGGRVVSADGRFVVFTSQSDGLLPGDGSAYAQVFLRDTRLGTTRLISRSHRGAPGDGDSGSPVVSADGSRVAFTTRAVNLGATPDQDRGVVMVWRRATDRASAVRAPGALRSGEPALSADGTILAFTAFGRFGPDRVWVRNLSTGRMARVAPGGSPAVSADGLRIAYQRWTVIPGRMEDHPADDVWVWDRRTHRRLLASRPDRGAAPAVGGASFAPSLNADGTRVAFVSTAAGMAAGDTDTTGDVFVRDLVRGRTTLVSRATGGVKGAGASSLPVISGDGRRVLFVSEAANLVPGDGNGAADVFVRDLALRRTIGVSRATGPRGRLVGITENGRPGADPDLRCIAFSSTAPAASGAGGGTDFARVYLRALGTCGAAPRR